MVNHGRAQASHAPTRLLDQHLLQCKLRYINVALEVCFGEASKVIRRIVGKRLCEEDPGIVDHNIDRAEFDDRHLGNFRRG